ncbi:transcriptional regulator with XRE-family HTH domain [Brevibacillus sp. AG162]|uniref:helix-turn-helix domain-containing protein n=1 Tax=Brevibacillus sp. AG162 TaxID=2572910 RepID=UPI00116C2BA3|nr:helix-turn-helix domain-containing protein [Brevibacillus sp. AG162]TQK62024.1 transcriptional regulator with XRE-family HTH domain [Brevibacillus sp. AG162]
MQKKTIGDMLSESRRNNGLSFAELEDRTGVSRGVLQKIESGETKRPEFKTVKSIAAIFPYPYEEIIEGYLEDENRSETLFEILQEVIQCEYSSLVERVSLKILQSPNEKIEKALERLYNFSDSTAVIVIKNEIRLALYQVIANYARQCGEPKYIAKALFKKYLIERNDLKKLKETFCNGEEILHYVDFLSHDEKITFYYRMALHAHNIEDYNKCIELGKKGHLEDKTSNTLKEQVALAICNSYLFLGKYSNLEEHLNIYEELKYTQIIKRLKLYRAIILSRTGKYSVAIPMLYQCVEEVTDSNRLHRVNMLLEALFKVNDLNSISSILGSEESKILLQYTDPYQYSELGRYYKYKGRFLVKRGCFDEGMEAYLNSILHYAKISDYKSILQCYNEIHSHHYTHEKMIKLELIGNLKEVYNKVYKESEARDE